MTISLALPTQASNSPVGLALHLDRLADAEWQYGHHGAAERLVHTTAAMREARP